MSDSRGMTEPTSRGHFAVDVAEGSMTLPPEGRRRRRRPRSTPKGDRGGSGMLSSEEMTMAMMGEMMLESSDPDVDAPMNADDGGGGPDTTFRDDVRDEWVDAIFGKDFFPVDDEGTGAEIGVRQGVGAAGVPHHVTYGAVLRPPPSTASSVGSHHNKPSLRTKTHASTPLIFSSQSSSSLGGGTLLASASLTSCGFETPIRGMGDDGMREDGAAYTVQPTPAGGGNRQPLPQEQRPKLGITISRIPLGLYVRSVSLDSEAYAAGIGDIPRIGTGRREWPGHAGGTKRSGPRTDVAVRRDALLRGRGRIGQGEGQRQQQQQQLRHPSRRCGSLPVRAGPPR